MSRDKLKEGDEWRCEALNDHEVIDGVDHCYCDKHGTETVGGHCDPCSRAAIPIESRLHERLALVESLLDKISAGSDVTKACSEWTADATAKGLK